MKLEDLGSIEYKHHVSQLASVWPEKYLGIKPPQNHILTVK